MLISVMPQKVTDRRTIVTDIFIHARAAAKQRRAPGAASRRGKSPNIFVQISGRALTFCKNLGATPNPKQPKCEFLGGTHMADRLNLSRCGPGVQSD